VRDDRIVDVGLITTRDVQLLGPTFDKLWPVEETPCFSQLLQAIDEADREVWLERYCRASERGPTSKKKRRPTSTVIRPQSARD